MPGAERSGPERRAVPRDAGEPPPRRRRARLAHHLKRAAVLLASATGMYVLFPGGASPGPAVLERGVVAPHDVVATIPFQIPKTEAELRREQEEAARGVPPVYDYTGSAADSVVGGLRGFFRRVSDALAQAQPPQRDAALRQVLSQSGVPSTLGGLAVLADSAQRASLLAATERAVREQFPRGVAASSPGRSGISAVRVRGLAGGERLIAADSMTTADQFYRAAQGYLPAGAGADAAELQRLLLVRWFQPSLAVNERETEAARGRARAAVDRVKYRVLAGEKIVGAREQVGEREEERLRAYQAALATHGGEDRPGRTVGRAIGSILYNLLLLSIVALLMRFSRAHLYRDGRSVAFMGVLTLMVAALAAVIARLGLPPELIPVPFAAMVIAVLWGGRLALAMALVLALILGGQAPFLGVAVPFTAAVGGAAAAFAVRLAQRRLQTWVVVGLIAAAYAATAVSIGLLRAWTLEEIAWSALWGAVNATGSALLAVGLLPVAEWFTRVTTNQTLQELADPKHPLLQRLSLEAPGTYAHTISVANLAEAVCSAIGANALLARVGVYYHDIGKIVKPQYFIENQPRGRNPHDKLKPSMSAAIVRSHVVEGLKLAEQYKLPDAVKVFIAQHHGTQPISFFLQQARESDPNCRVEARDFAYLGPKPQTREVAVVMLSDSVESAARVLQDPTPEKIRELVERIVNGKIQAGQLDQCPLTLKEIGIAKEVLARALGSMYHHRVDYPAPANGNGGADASSAAEGEGKGPVRVSGGAAGSGQGEPAPAGAAAGGASER
ncbi:MAG TPA: HDIG domain-containing protein [Longimicrobium sp.]|nr:HDIG domain-containing protein [Longimicrobium sp.]